MRGDGLVTCEWLFRKEVFILLILLGLPVLMKVPQEKAPAYMTVVILCGIVLSVIVSWVSGTMLSARDALRALLCCKVWPRCSTRGLEMSGPSLTHITP